MECRCTHVAVPAGAAAEAYAAEHLHADGAELICPDTGARRRAESRDGQDVLVQLDRERHAGSRPHADEV